MISGVCGGIGEHFGWDPTLVRVGFVALTLFTGVFPGVIAYFILSVVIPD